MFVRFFLLLVPFLSFFLANAHKVPSLTPDNYDDMTDGKTVFIKFFAPWCGHCKKMAPDWEKLSEKWDGNEIGLVAEVDCTAEGKPLCEAESVHGFPTIKYGDPSGLDEYQGPRSYSDLFQFAKRNLKPICGPHSMDLCDDDKKAKLEEFLTLSASELEEKIRQERAKIKKAEKEFEENVDVLQEQYKKILQTKEEKIAEVKDAGFGMLKSVMMAKKKAEDIKDEL